ncbi:MAG: putative photosynthetic complex assembly protein PuhE [Pseudomonadota bacterium]
MGYIVALLTVIFLWWLSTGVILMLSRSEKRAQFQNLVLLSLTSLACLALVPAVNMNATTFASVMGFGQGLVIWAWLEYTYLSGYLTGPQKAPCPEGSTDWERFVLGIKTSIYHDVAVIAAVGIVLAMSVAGPNKIALYTLLSLWAMRWSAKLNLFLGVRNYNVDWFPSHLQHLDSYTKRAPLNALFPLSVTAGTVAAALAIHQGATSGTGYDQMAGLLIGALLTLGVLEHWFLVLPFNESQLWRWAVSKPSSTPAEPVQPQLASVHTLCPKERTSPLS